MMIPKTVLALSLITVISITPAFAETMAIEVDGLMKVNHAVSYTSTGIEIESISADLGTLLSSADYVSLHVPLLDSTKHMINAEKIATMKKTARVINTSRGGVIDEEALYDALKNGDLGGAALDVFEVEPSTSNKLRDLPNFVSTPHMGAQTKEAQSLAANVIAEKIIQILRGVI